MSKTKVARDIVITVIDNLCLLDMGPDGVAEKTAELYEAAADYLIRDFEADDISLEDLEDGLDYEDAEDLD